MKDLFYKWAIVTKVVEAGSIQKTQVGHTFIQKVIYMLQSALGVKTGYDFKLYYYGPYSEDLWADLQLLSDLGILHITPDPNGYGYWISIKNSESQKLIAKQANTLPEDKINEAITGLGQKGVEELELIATTHFVKNDLVRKKQDAKESEVIKGVLMLKPHFEKPQVENAIKKLKSFNWY